MNFVDIATQFLKQLVAFIITVLVKRHDLLTEEDVQHATKNKKMNEMRKQYIEQKVYTVVEMWKCGWWKLYKTDVSVKVRLRESIPYRFPLFQYLLLEKKAGALFC